MGFSIKIFIGSQKHPIITRASMKSLEDRLNRNNFIRVHKSFIVNTDKINSIRKAKITIGEVNIPVSDLYKEHLNTFVDSKKIQ